MTVTNVHSCIENPRHRHINSACRATFRKSHPDTPQLSSLTSWAVLVREYYIQDATTFLWLEPSPAGVFHWKNPQTDLHAQKISIPISAELSVEELRKHMFESSRDASWEHWSNGNAEAVTEGHSTAVLVLNDEQVDDGTSPDAIFRIFEWLQIDLLLIAHISQDGTYFNAVSDSSKRPELTPCAILKSFTKIYKCLFESNTKVHQLNPVTKLDMERFIKLNAKKDLQPQKSETLHCLIKRQCSKRPNEVALLSTTTSITYAEVAQRSAAIAYGLVKGGVATGDYVGLCLQKSPTEIIAVLGILRAGAAYTPIDSSQPPSRIMKVVDGAGIRHVITDETSRDKFRDIKAGLIDVNKIQEITTPDESWEPYTDPSMPVYVMFTSGSTGTPKGVIHQHGSVSGSLVECIEELHIDHSTRFMQWGSLAFDASILEVFAALVAGGCLCIPSEEERNSELELFMRKMKVNYAWLVPSLVPQIQPENLPDLHDLSVGGEPLSKEVLATWANRVRLHNTYGITEGGVWDILKFEMKPDDNFRNIGRGIGSLSCWITDPSDVHRLKPFGAEGELVIQSPYLAQDYLNDPQRSAVAFLDPSSVEWASQVPALKGARLYRTGDLAKFNDKGEIIFLGRKTGFVKIRGLRVDLEGVEAAINSTIQTGRSAVVLSEADSDAEIVAFMETSDNIESPLPDEMSKRLSEILVDYMIPSIFIRVDKLPLTGSKKIDRQQLRRDLSKMSQKQLRYCRRGGSSKDEYEKIPDKRPIAIEISRKISDMLTSEDTTSLRGKNFPLHAVGINSIQFVSLAKWLFKEYGKKIKVEALRNLHSVCDVEDIVMDKILEESKKNENQDLVEEFVKLKAKLPLRKRTVFCTSITGFLGSQVLRALLQSPEVGQVIGLVRAENQELAMEKVQKQAEIAQWWELSFQNRIKILLGDLSKPQLGLDEGDWNRAFGKFNESPIDAIIHNGAKVNWMSNYAELELVNVISTLDVLSGMSNMPSPCSLVYISGGYLSNREESPTELANRLSRASGYDQTKFMSERLVSEYNKNVDYQKFPAPKARTILPAFIVGTQKEGIAHPEDFLWRFAFTIARIGAMSNDLSRVAVAGVDQVSSLISNVALHPDQYSAGTLACGDGVSTSTFCSILSKKLKISIQCIDHDCWMKILREDVDNADFEHPFLPVLEWFEDNQWHMADPQDASKNRYFDESGIVKALESSVDYLIDMGYFTEGGLRVNKDRAEMFSRSRN